MRINMLMTTGTDPVLVLIGCVGTLGVLSLVYFIQQRGLPPSPPISPPESPPEQAPTVDLPPQQTAPPPPADKAESKPDSKPLFDYPLEFRPSDADIQANPIWRFLEKHSFAWLTPRAELQSHAIPHVLPVWGEKVIPLPHRHPDLQHTITPASFSPGIFLGELPPAGFWSVLSHRSSDPKANFDHIVTALEVDLGPHQMTEAVNVYSAVWKSGPAKIEVIVWPKHLNAFQYQPGSWKGDPATLEAVHIYFHPGLSFHLHDSERDLMLSASPLEVPDAALITSPHRSTYTDLDFLRRLPVTHPNSFQSLRCKFLLNESTRHLFLIGDDYALIIPLQIARGLQLARVTPAKGSGHSTLCLLINPWSPKRSRMITLAQGKGPDDLTEMAKSLGPQLKLPVEILPYEADY